MSRSRFSFAAFIGLAAVALAAIAAVPARAVAFVLERIGTLFNVRPFVTLVAGPRLVLESPEGAPCAAALIQRHEAGLARLGAVRHR